MEVEGVGEGMVGAKGEGGTLGWEGGKVGVTDGTVAVGGDDDEGGLWWFEVFGSCADVDDGADVNDGVDDCCEHEGIVGGSFISPFDSFLLLFIGLLE